MAKLKKIKMESLRSQVYMQLKNQLMKGVWKAGEKLPSESELCALLGVSRVTVRAAIQQLEILGLIETRHGGGSFVREFSSVNTVEALHPLIQINGNRDIITVLEYRKIIEKGTIGLIAPKITKNDIDKLEENYRLTVSLSRTDQTQKQAEADHLFHHQLARITDNPIITKVYEVINIILSSAMIEIVRLLGTEMALRYHRQLIDALKTGDKALCEATMEAHIEETIQKIRNKNLTLADGAERADEAAAGVPPS
ncbi:MAG: FadR family transcriptional regulator [Candidatus Accumulibacter sp.]|nr:FadR family transcriptional regulator [Accumulibacter sp.]